MRQTGSLACHVIGGSGGDLAPDLMRIDAKLTLPALSVGVGLVSCRADGGRGG